MNKEKEVYDKKVSDYIDKITTPIFEKTLQEDLSNSMTTHPLYKSNGFRYLVRFNNLRRQIPVKEKTNSTLQEIKGTISQLPMELNINPRTKLISIKNFKSNVTIQYGKNTLTAIYKCPLINGHKQTRLIERDTIDGINARIDEIKEIIKKTLDSSLKEFSRKFEVSLPFKKPIWSRHEIWIKGDEFIDKILRECIIHDTIGKKVYAEGFEFAGGKEIEPTATIKNYLKNRAIEDIAPEIAESINKFGAMLTGNLNMMAMLTNQNLEITKLRRDVTKIQRHKKPINNKDLRKWL